MRLLRILAISVLTCFVVVAGMVVFGTAKDISI
jgi:hypothetical protein